MEKDKTVKRGKVLKIIWPDWQDICNDSFVPLVGRKDRYMILYGGRGSSKSMFVAMTMLFNCLTHGFFRCLMVRNDKTTVRGSCFQTLKDLIDDMGLKQAFYIRESRMEIICTNGNMIVAAGVDEPQKIKSFKDPTCIWYEEDIPSWNNFITITSSVRTQKADYLQEWFSINPEVEGEDYSDNWFFKKFFADKYPGELSFAGQTSTEMVTPKNLRKKVTYDYTVHHSTYHDNVWCSDDLSAILEALKDDDEYYYTVYTQGLWGRRAVTERYYRKFSHKTHIKPARYNPSLPLHISFDFNVNPYVSIVVFQAIGKVVRCIDEIAAADPHNTTEEASKLFYEKFKSHRSGLFIYGDPSGRQMDTRSEKGKNDYKIIMKTLYRMRPQKRIDRRAPSLVMRGQFLNAVMGRNEGGIRIEVDPKCKRLVTDFMEVRTRPDGSKFKKVVRKEGLSYEQFGHHSDCFDYFMCRYFRADYNDYRHYFERKQPSGKSGKVVAEVEGDGYKVKQM